jgi:hypothetical protein
MTFLPRKSLGLAFSSQSLQVAELSVAGKTCRFLRAAEFTFGAGDSLQQPAQLGKKLAQFLKANRFSARQAVLGLPAQWLMLKEVTVPPASGEALAGMLRLQAERDFSMEPEALISDYLASPPGLAAGVAQPVVLAAALRERIEQMRQVAQAAGVKPMAITVTALALAALSPNSNALYFGANGAELAVRRSNGLPRLYHLASCQGGLDPAQLAGELRRALLELAPGVGQARELPVWDDLGISGGLLEKLPADARARLVPVKNFKAAAWNGMAEVSPGAAGGSALALCLFQPGLAGLDFLHSRLAVAPPSKLKGKAVWGAAAGAALLFAAGALLLDCRESMEQVAQQKGQLEGLEKSAAEARNFIGRFKMAEAWYNRRPNYLACLRALTLRLPEDGSIWASSLNLREDMRVVLTGFAADEKSVLDFVDRLKKAGAKPKSRPEFAEIKIDHTRSAEAKNSEISFSVSFVFEGGQ